MDSLIGRCNFLFYHGPPRIAVSPPSKVHLHRSIAVSITRSCHYAAEPPSYTRYKSSSSFKSANVSLSLGQKRFVSTSESTPYRNLSVGIPKEIYHNEQRVAITPTNVSALLKKGFRRVLVERDAGAAAMFPNSAYEHAGASLASSGTVWSESDIILKVRPPSIAAPDETANLQETAVLISFLQPAQNKRIVDALAHRRSTAFAMDLIPRISRAQIFDALSSMANIAGYKAVLEASNHFGRFL